LHKPQLNLSNSSAHLKFLCLHNVYSGPSSVLNRPLKKVMIDRLIDS